MLGRARHSARFVRHARKTYAHVGGLSSSSANQPASELPSSAAGCERIPVQRMLARAASSSTTPSRVAAVPAPTVFLPRSMQHTLVVPKTTGGDHSHGGSNSSSRSGASSTAFAGALGALLALLAGVATVAAAPALDEDSVRSILSHLLVRPERAEWRPEATEAVTGIRFPQVCEAFVSPDEMMRMRLVGTGIRAMAGMVYFRPARAYVAGLYVPEAVADAFQAAPALPADDEWLDVASLATASGGEFPRTLRIVFVQDAPARHIADGFIRSFKSRLALLEKAASAVSGSKGADAGETVLASLARRLAACEARLREQLAHQRTVEMQDEVRARRSYRHDPAAAAAAAEEASVSPAEVAIEPSEWGEAISAEFSPSEQALLPLLRSSRAATETRLQQLEAALSAVGTFRAGDEVVLTATPEGALLVTLPRGFSAAAALDGDQVLALAEERVKAELWAAASAASSAVPEVPAPLIEAASAEAIATLRSRAAAITAAASKASAAAEAAIKAVGSTASPAQAAADLPVPAVAAAEAALAEVARFTAADTEALAAAEAKAKEDLILGAPLAVLDAAAASAAASAAVAAAFASVSDPLSVRRCLEAGARVKQHNATVARRRNAAAAEHIAESIAEGVSEEKRALASSQFATPTLSPGAVPHRPALMLTAPRLTTAVLATYLAADGVSGDIRSRLAASWRLLMSGPAARGDPDPNDEDGGAAALVAALQGIINDAADCERGVQPRDPRFAAAAAARLQARWGAAEAAAEAARGVVKTEAEVMAAAALAAGAAAGKKPEGHGPVGAGPGYVDDDDELALPPDLAAEAARRAALSDALTSGRMTYEEADAADANANKKPGFFGGMYDKLFGGAKKPTPLPESSPAPAPEPEPVPVPESAPVATPHHAAAPGTVGRSPSARFLQSLRVAIAELDASPRAGAPIDDDYYPNGEGDVADDMAAWEHGTPARGHAHPSRTTEEFLALLRRAQLDSGVTPDALPREQRDYLLDRAADLIYAVTEPAPAPPPEPSAAEAALAAERYARGTRRGERVGLGLGSADTASLGKLEPAVSLNAPLRSADAAAAAALPTNDEEATAMTDDIIASLHAQMAAENAIAEGRLPPRGFGGGYGAAGMDDDSPYDARGRRRGHLYGGAPRELVEASQAAEMQRYMARAGITPADLLAAAGGADGADPAAAAAGRGRDVLSPQEMARELAGDRVRRSRGSQGDMWGNAIGRLNNGGYDPSVGDLYGSSRPFPVPESVARRYGQSPLADYERRQEEARVRGYGYGYTQPGVEEEQRGELKLPVDRNSR